jgi:hypothetical protein
LFSFLGSGVSSEILNAPQGTDNGEFDEFVFIK